MSHNENKEREHPSLLGNEKRPPGPPGGPPGEPEEITTGHAIMTMLFVSVPLTFQLLLGYAQAVINFAFIGSYDVPSLLGGLGLGMTFYVCLYGCFMVGMNSTITTFASQLRGMGQIKRSGHYLNASRIITVGLAIPIMVFMGFSEQILLAIGQDATIAYHASRFCLGLLPSVVFYGWVQGHMFYLNSFQKTAAGMISSILCLVVQVLFNYLLITKLNMGTLGCGLALTIAVVFQAVYLYLAVHFDPELHEANFWPTFDHEQWEIIKTFLSLGIPQLVMSFIEILGVECMQPLSGLISVNSSSAQAVAMLTYAGCMVIMLGISITTSIFVGRCIGMGNIEGGRIYEKVALVFSLIVALILLVLIYIFQSSIASAFTTVVEVQDLAKSALKIVAFLPIPLAIFYIETGVFRGMSKQQTSAFFSIVTLFIISIPLGCYLAYCAGMNIAGFWVGFITRTCFCAAIFLFLSFKWFDWNEVARETRDRERVIRQKLATSDESETQASYGTINEKA